MDRGISYLRMRGDIGKMPTLIQPLQFSLTSQSLVSYATVIELLIAYKCPPANSKIVGYEKAQSNLATILDDHVLKNDILSRNNHER